MKKVLLVVAVIALISVATMALVGCVPSDPAKAEANLKDAGYEVMVTKASDSTGVQHGTGIQLGPNAVADGCVTMITAMKATISNDDADFDGVVIYYFNDGAKAKAFYEKQKARYDKLSDEEKEGSKVGKSGKVVYVGTEEAIKAAK